MKSIVDDVGPYTLRFERDRFAMLVRSIVSQQISTIAARAIRKRLLELAGRDGLTAANLARFTIDRLRSVGLSQQKASYIADLSCKVNDGTVDLRGIGRLSDERVVETLTQVKGIGRWTAQIVPLRTAWPTTQMLCRRRSQRHLNSKALFFCRPADAKINGKTVVVTSDKVRSPVAVRYAYAVSPENCNLYSRDGLPASPFCSDPSLLQYDPGLPK